MISIILPVYNREKTVVRAAESVLKQSIDEDLELIIVDDKSNDDTLSRVERLKDPRVRIVKMTENGGACKARNEGIRCAKGEYIAFQDSDDEWLDGKLKKQVELLKASQSDLVFCGFTKWIGEKSTKIPRRRFSLPENNEDIFTELLMDNFVSTQTILAKREVFEEVKFDESLPRMQDWDLMLRVAERYNIRYLDEYLVNVYVQKDSISSNPEKGLAAIKKLQKKYKRHIEADQRIKDNFLKKECIFGFKAGVDMRKEAKRYLRSNFSLKVFYVYLRSLVRFGRKHNET